MQHSKIGYGENLAQSWGFFLTFSRPIQLWVNEKQYYNAQTHRCDIGRLCGHYTQVVWSTTTHLGCATTQAGNESVVVCQYYPPGNYIGRTPF